MPAPDIQTLYDLETPPETMFSHLFGAEGIAVYTPANASFVDDPAWQSAYPDLIPFIFSNEEEFQKVRPRVELRVAAGAATEHLATFGQAVKNLMRSDSYEGTATIWLVTENNIALHRSYRGLCRKIMGDVFPSDHMPYHEINKCLEAGTTVEIASDSGLMRSTIEYNLHFNIKPDAWPA